MLVGLLYVQKYLSYTYFVLFQEFRELFEGSGTNPGDKTLEDKFFEHEVVIFNRL